MDLSWARSFWRSASWRCSATRPGLPSQEGAATLGWAMDQRDWLWPGQAWADSAPGLIARAHGSQDARLGQPPRLAAADRHRRARAAAASPGCGRGGIARARPVRARPDRGGRRLRAASAPRRASLPPRLGRGRRSGADRAAGGRRPPPRRPRGCAARKPLALGLLWSRADTGLRRQRAPAPVALRPSARRGPGGRGPAGRRRWPEPARPRTLGRADFAEHERASTSSSRLLRGARRPEPRASTCCSTARRAPARPSSRGPSPRRPGARLFAVGEADLDGEEPSRLRAAARAASARSACSRAAAAASFSSTRWRICSPRRAGRRAAVAARARRSTSTACSKSNDGAGDLDQQRHRRRSIRRTFAG